MPKRDYQNDYPSVTTVLGVLRKIGLENWYKVTPLKEINEKSEKGKTIGLQGHEIIHNYIAGLEQKISTQYPQEVMTGLKSFILFKQKHPEIKLKNAEVTMTSKVHQFNGTRDCDGEENGNIVLFDWKFREAKQKEKPDIYEEDKYQVSAYDALYQETMGILPAYNYILALAKDKIAYNLYKVEREEIDFYFRKIFLQALGIYNAQKEVIKFRKEQ
jgi:CRISPR/Cas system-associated exonuclease Cas4 (RecB family)